MAEHISRVRFRVPPNRRALLDDPALDRRARRQVENGLGAPNIGRCEPSCQPLNPLLNVGPIQATELCVSEERQHVTIKRLAVANAG